MRTETPPHFPNIDTLEHDDDYWLGQVNTDFSAFDVIYNRYLRRIYRYVFRRVANIFEAEDITSDIFLNALEKILKGNYQCNNHFTSWLFTIARRRIADYYRKPADCPLDTDISLNVGQMPTLQECESLDDLLTHFTGLSEYEQDLLALRFSAQLDFKKIAQIVEKSVPSVKMATHRALRKLRTNMRGEGHEG